MDEKPVVKPDLFPFYFFSLYAVFDSLLAGSPHVFEEIFQHTLRCCQEVLFSIFSLKVILYKCDDYIIVSVDMFVCM